MLSSEKLKAFASFDATLQAGNGDGSFEGNLIVNSPLNAADTDPLRTIRPYVPKRAQTSDAAPAVPVRSTERVPSIATQLPVSPIKTGLQQPPKKFELPLRPSALYREDSVEDYSDLIATNDVDFEQKLQGMRVSEWLS
jgi:hypothetical protein